MAVMIYTCRSRAHIVGRCHFCAAIRPGHCWFHDRQPTGSKALAVSRANSSPAIRAKLTISHHKPKCQESVGAHDARYHTHDVTKGYSGPRHGTTFKS